LSFPEHVYTLEEFRAARSALASGYKHELKISGSMKFRRKVRGILGLIELAGYLEFLRTYIREVKEVDGLGQLREADAAIWLSSLNLSNPVECARFVIQKALQMQAYLEGRPWYNLGELAATRGSIEFLHQLRRHLNDGRKKAQCEEAIRLWTEDRVT